MTYLNIAITLLVTIATLVQGLDAGINLYNRWQSKSTKNELSRSSLSETINQRAFKITQFKVLVVIYSLVYFSIVIFEIQPLSHFASIQTTYANRYLYLSMYLVFLIIYPMLRFFHPNSGKEIKIAFVFVFVLLIFANLTYFDQEFVKKSWFPLVSTWVNAITFQMFRVSLLLFVIKVYFMPWFIKLPQK